MTPTPSRAWRRQALALRLIVAVADSIPASYSEAGDSLPHTVHATLVALEGYRTALEQINGIERQVLTTDRLRRQFDRQLVALRGKIHAQWPGAEVPGPALLNAALLVAEDVVAQAPAGARRATWEGVVHCLDYLMTHNGWEDETQIEPGMQAGEALKTALWQ